MPVDVTPNFIRIRVANPSQFVRFRFKTLGKGIRAVIGFRKKGGSAIQSFVFPKSSFTLAKAKAWVKSHGYHVAESFYIYDFKNLQSDNVADWFVEETANELDDEDLKDCPHLTDDMKKMMGSCPICESKKASKEMKHDDKYGWMME